MNAQDLLAQVFEDGPIANRMSYKINNAKSPYNAYLAYRGDKTIVKSYIRFQIKIEGMQLLLTEEVVTYIDGSKIHASIKRIKGKTLIDLKNFKTTPLPEGSYNE